jgi:hypothetical protein
MIEKTFKDKFLWKEGDITLIKNDFVPTKEQIEHAEKTLKKVIKDFKEKNGET